LNLTVGGRFTEDERDIIYTVSAYGDRSRLGGLEGCAPPATLCGTEANPVGFTTTLDGDWDDFSGKVSLQYDLSDTSMVYALYSEGFLSGGFQHDAISLAAVAEPFDESTTQNFELGWKADYERARVAVTLFHLEEDDSQVGGLIPVAGGGFTSLINNLGGIESDGIEVEGTWLATDNLLLGGSFSFIDSEIVDSIVVATRGGALEDVSGLRPTHTPEETAALYGEYTVNLGNGSNLMFRLDYTHRSDVWDNTANRDTTNGNTTNPQFIFLRPKLNDFGARVTWVSAGGQTRVMLWGKNLNEDYDVVSTGPPFLSFQRPQTAFGKTTYGVTASFNF
jgi:iron complex outermembrane receptor protein